MFEYWVSSLEIIASGDQKQKQKFLKTLQTWNTNNKRCHEQTNTINGQKRVLPFLSEENSKCTKSTIRILLYGALNIGLRRMCTICKTSKMCGWLFDIKFAVGKTIEIIQSNEFEGVKSISNLGSWLKSLNLITKSFNSLLKNVRRQTFGINFKIETFRSIENYWYRTIFHYPLLFIIISNRWWKLVGRAFQLWNASISIGGH